MSPRGGWFEFAFAVTGIMISSITAPKVFFNSAKGGPYVTQTCDLDKRIVLLTPFHFHINLFSISLVRVADYDVSAVDVHKIGSRGYPIRRKNAIY